MSDTFNRIKAGLEDAIEYARGDTKDRRVHRIDVPAVNVRSIRHRTGLTQQEFSMKYGFAVHRCATGSKVAASQTARRAFC